MFSYLECYLVEQLLRDIDDDIWRFCLSFHHHLKELSDNLNDPVIREFSNMGTFTYGKVNAKLSNDWDRHQLRRVTVKFDVSKRTWAELSSVNDEKIAGRSGFLYSLFVKGYGQYNLGYADFLEETKVIHDRLVYIFLTNNGGIRIIIPCKAETTELIETFRILLSAAMDSLGTQDRITYEEMQALADKFPEYVLGPFHPLTVSSEMERVTKPAIFGA